MSTMPNVIVVMTDQLRACSIGCYGDAFVRTPHINALAATGVRFETCISNAPLCSPARSCLLTGQHARTCVGSRLNEMTRARDGMIDEAERLGRDDRLKHPDPTLPEQLGARGYRTAVIGKWHIDTRPRRMGFDESVIPDEIFTKGTFIENEGEAFRVDGFTSDYEIHRVKEYIAKNRKDPFFLYYTIIHPHMPLLDVPYQYSRMYDPARVPLRDNVWINGRLPRSPRWDAIYMWEEFYGKGVPPFIGKSPPGFSLRDLTALYYGSVSIVDDLVGELIRTLRANGLLEKTLIVFTSDHGELLGSHHLWNKDRLYEEAVRVPLLVSWPGRIPRNAVLAEQQASLIDIMPTVLGLTGADIPSSVQGRNLAAVVAEGAPPVGNDVFIDTPFGEIGIRTRTHKLGMLVREDTSIQEENHQFFDLVQDPFEMRNRAGTGEAEEIAEVLRAKLLAWNRDTPVLSTGAPFTSCLELNNSTYFDHL